MTSRRRYFGRKKPSSGQAPVLAGLLFLLLVPTTIILAENASDNITGSMIANISPPAPSLNVSPPVEIQESNETLLIEPTDNKTLPVAGPENRTNSTSEEVIPPTPSENTTYNESSPATEVPASDNQTNSTLQGNVTNKTQSENPTVREDDNQTNRTGQVNVTNQTQENETISEELNKTRDNETRPDIEIPDIKGRADLLVKLDLPERVYRSEAFKAKATVENLGNADASNVELSWEIPKGFSVSRGDISTFFDISVGNRKEFIVKLIAPLEYPLGTHDINVLVREHD